MRYPSIDILRTFAIFVMVLTHFAENLSGYKPPIAGLGAPVFAFLSEVSYVLWVRGQQRKGRSEGDISKVSVRRGLFVFFLGFAFNVFVWFPDDTFNWDVLTFIGAALLLLNVARHVPLPILVLMAVCSVLVSPILRVMADYDAYWVEGYYEGDLTLSDVLIGFLAVGYFPIFPWIAYSLTGFVTATVVFRESSDFRRLSGRTVWVGFILIGTSAASLLVRPYLPEVLSQRVLGGWYRHWSQLISLLRTHSIFTKAGSTSLPSSVHSTNSFRDYSNVDQCKMASAKIVDEVRNTPQESSTGQQIGRSIVRTTIVVRRGRHW